MSKKRNQPALLNTRSFGIKKQSATSLLALEVNELEHYSTKDLLTYSAESWPLISKHKYKHQFAEMKYLRRVNTEYCC